ncbi:MAG: hypothetical protein GY703_19050 [Gammaproteobacteria bacterium]|nr:hypothetical protein [Gammaproteobacteria bacterium]
MIELIHPYYTSGIGIAVSQQSELSWITVLRCFVSNAFLQAAGALGPRKLISIQKLRWILVQIQGVERGA